ncbi:hypothetical protein FIBSPDRAFT_218568 [Athelia psychrophila]|uniref:Uncharacterized protein n=1 Tax=Athelia psychrophila TaxID=1759441 RepID=A0A165Z9E2_9AGAM|nr:hypothetical protein FIBSPDRAFT_218568 [Fibularhizoctonia sp. CBS 109695]
MWGCGAPLGIHCWVLYEHIQKRRSLLILRQLRPRTAKVMITMFNMVVNTTTIKIKNTIRIITRRGPARMAPLSPPCRAHLPQERPTPRSLCFSPLSLPHHSCKASTNSYRGEIHASRFDGALRGPESDSINSADLGVVVELLVVIFFAFGEVEVHGVPEVRSPQCLDLCFF